MSDRERRGSARRLIRLACEVRFPSGVTIAGITRNISSEGVEVEANSVSDGKDKTPIPGELGLLTLKFRSKIQKGRRSGIDHGAVPGGSHPR